MENLMTTTRESYQKIAPVFSETRNFSWPEIDWAIEKYLKNNCKILDLGCGNGRLLIALKKYLNDFDYTGIDSCQELIEKANYLFSENTLAEKENKITKSTKINFYCQNILSLEKFKNNSFDFVFIIATLNHIASPQMREKILLEIKRILKPGGFLIMTNWNLWQFNSKKSFWHNLLNKRVKSYGLGLTDFKEVITFWQNQFPLYYHAFTLKELKKILNRAGFKILSNQYVYRGKKSFCFKANNILTIGQK